MLSGVTIPSRLRASWFFPSSFPNESTVDPQNGPSLPFPIHLPLSLRPRLSVRDQLVPIQAQLTSHIYVGSFAIVSVSTLVFEHLSSRDRLYGTLAFQMLPLLRFVARGYGGTFLIWDIPEKGHFHWRTPPCSGRTQSTSRIPAKPTTPADRDALLNCSLCASWADYYNLLRLFLP